MRMTRRTRMGSEIGVMFLPICGDGESASPGQRLYDEDGQAWVVEAVNGGHDNNVWVHKPDEDKTLSHPASAYGFAHTAPPRAAKEIAKVMRLFADSNNPANPNTLRRWAEELDHAE